MPAKKMPKKKVKTASAKSSKSLAGTQTLVRGLDVVDAVAHGATTLVQLCEQLDLTRSTTHRLASTLVRNGFITFTPGAGYALGPKLLELGFLARQQMSLPRVGDPYLEQLSQETGDTVHLGVLDGMRALYLAKVPGRRRVDISSRVGERQPVRSTGLGKALLLDETEERWKEFYNYEEERGQDYVLPLDEWLSRMREYALMGIAFDIEENEDRIRCVAAPVRDVTGDIVGAVSLSSAAQYMDELRMARLRDTVGNCAESISHALGWNKNKARLSEGKG